MCVIASNLSRNKKKSAAEDWGKSLYGASLETTRCFNQPALGLRPRLTGAATGIFFDFAGACF
jgi:hypothetical protein